MRIVRSHHEESLRQVLFSGSGFRASRGLIGTLHAAMQNEQRECAHDERARAGCRVGAVIQGRNGQDACCCG